jgi:prephenate dehydrogenase
MAGVIDRAGADPDAEIAAADLVLLAPPVGALESWLGRTGAAMRADAVVTEVGSVKGAVVASARRRLGSRLPRLVPGHPIAGGEQSGFEAARADLFEGHRVILTPLPETDRDALDRVRGLWRMAGADVVEMDAGDHDRILSLTSHLPHVLAYALVDLLVSGSDRGAALECAAGGFRDITRIASSDPVMWRDICLANRDEILKRMDEFMENFNQIRQAIETSNGEGLERCFQRAREGRAAIPDPPTHRRAAGGWPAAGG